MIDKIPMMRLVTIDLVGADLPTFELYEAAVLPLLSKYKARLEFRVRARDNTSETHLLTFPNAAAYDQFRADPQRAVAQDIWHRSRAKMTSIEVTRLET